MVIVVSVTVFDSTLTLYTGSSQMDAEKITLIYSLGDKRKGVLLKILLPGPLSLVISSMKVNIGPCLAGVIIDDGVRIGAKTLLTHRTDPDLGINKLHQIWSVFLNPPCTL